ncbi:MAG TPA: hypothetical protein VNW68_07035 [Candidatus Limnocylindria bacterium]|nr:hypothetical protein [Candidatus Limnocylindria bacterium]
MPDIGPAAVLSLIVGAFHTGAYLVLRGRLGLITPVVLVVAVLGALAAQPIVARVGDPLLIGDYGVLWASLFAWLGIIVVVGVSMLARSVDGP